MMPKVPKDKVILEQIENDIWTDDETAWWSDEYREDYWDNVISGEMTWQWWMEASIRRREGWHYIVISSDHKNLTVINWIKETHPEAKYKNEKSHFLFEDQKIATWVALKWG